MGGGRCGERALGWAISQFKSLGLWPKRKETGPKSIGIGWRRFVGTGPGIFGLTSSMLGSDLVLTSAILGQILKKLSGPFELSRVEGVGGGSPHNEAG